MQNPHHTKSGPGRKNKTGNSLNGRPTGKLARKMQAKTLTHKQG